MGGGDKLPPVSNCEKLYKMKTKSIFISACAVLLALLASCRQEKKMEVNYTWECEKSDMKDTFDVQSLFADRYILGLEETEKSRVGAIGKLVKVDTLLFVMDNRLAMRVFVFNANTGKFINSIGKVGNGPGEYTDINDFAVDTSNSTVSLLCGRNSVLSYDYKGAFKWKKEISLFADKMECEKGKYYFICYDEGRGNLVVTDHDMHVTAEYLTNRQDEPVVILWNPLQKLQDGTITFFRYIDDTVYQLDDNDSLQVRYKLDFGSNGIDRSQVNKDNAREMEKIHRGSIYFCTENEKYAWVGFCDTDDSHETILYKETRKTVAFPSDNMIDSSLGSYDYSPQYAMQGMMAAVLDGESIKDDLVRNKDCNRGGNPAIYFMVNK